MQNIIAEVYTNGLLKPPRLTLDAAGIGADLRRYFCHTLGRDRLETSPHYLYTALALTVRDRLMERLNNTRHAYEQHDSRRTCYLSMEYLMGRALSNTVLNLGLEDSVRQALHDLGLELEQIAEYEQDAGLGNGGLGRLAACFLDSCATLGLPVIGYGIRYRYGMFRQHIENGRQVEDPDNWLRDGYAWELERPEYAQRIHFGGRSEYYHDSVGQLQVRWIDTHDVLAIPYDIPIPGYRNGIVNTLRLWSAISTDEFDLAEFNAGSYPEAVAAQNAAENITMVLYPNDASENGKELRLRQQYFLAAASLKDTLRQWHNRYGDDFSRFGDKHCFQLNDTHPSIAVAELMRLLMDQHGMGWDAAWRIVTRCMAYTNHTLLPEALERWPVRLFKDLLPRHLEIIYEINARFMTEVARRWPGDTERQRRMSLIEEGPEAMVRMAYLAIVGSFSINGVAELHSHLLKQGLFRDFYELWPQRFGNVTNGVTPRRWLAAANPALAALITQNIGPAWVTDLNQLAQLAERTEDAEFRARWRAVKQHNKNRLAELVQAECGVRFDPEALFDVQVKRIHEYKRQLLNILHVIHLYCRIKRGDASDWVKRCVLIGGKAAPGYTMAKLIIKFINNVAKAINEDPEVGDRLKVAFLPNYRVTSMEIICPGTDLSEQISTAGKEASGTGNMKFMMNGALTIGTLDGANIEIRDAVGADNFFLFGLNAEQVAMAKQDYDPQAIIAADADLHEVIELIRSGFFNQFEPGLFDPILSSIINPKDAWLTAADFASFVDAQRQAARAYLDQEHWTRMSILNSAACGRFSTDRTIQDYNSRIWHLEPVTVS